MHLQIPPELTPALTRHAAATGVDAEQWVIQAIRRELSAESARSVMLPRPDWKARFEGLRSAFPRRSTNLDDSRDSIYDEDRR